MIKSFFEIFKLYWGYFMTFVAAITFIWTLGVKSERKSNENISVKQDVTEIKDAQKVQSKNIDSLLIIIKDIQINQIKLTENQNAMRNSYVKYISNDKTLKLDDFLEYMNGIEFQIETPKDGTVVKPDLNVTIKKLKK